MSYNNVPLQYNALLGQEDVPSTFLPTTASKMVPMTSSLKSVRTQSASVGASSTALFSVQTGAGQGWLQSNSVYLRGTLVLTMGAVAGTWKFSGPSAPAGGIGEGLNKNVGSASALISRLTVSNGSQQLSQLTNYNVWHDILSAHAVSSDYIVNDSTIYEFTGVTRGVGAAPTANERTINFAIPLLSPLFCGEQSLPLFLMNAPLSCEILVNSIADAFVLTGGATITSFLLNNLEICYSSVDASPELKSGIMAKLNAGALWKQYSNSIFSIQTDAGSGTSYNIGVGVSSAKAVIGVDRNPSAIGVGTTGDFMLNGFSNVRVSYDGKLITNYDLTTDASVFAELNRSLSAMYDSNVTSCLSKNNAPAAGDTTWSDYVVSKFAWGASSSCVSDSTVGFSGVPVQMITIQHFNATAANSSAFPYVNEAYVAGRSRCYFILYDELLTIDSNGVCSLVR